MGDGVNDATLDRRRGSGVSDDQRITPSPLTPLGAAPWERFSAPSCDDNVHRWQAEPPIDRPAAPDIETQAEASETQKVGGHTDGGLSVADLIAKLGAPTHDRPNHHHVAQHEAPDDEPSQVAPDVPADQQDTQVIDTPAYLFEVVAELPDLGAATYPNGGDFHESEADGTSEVPTASRRRIRSKSAAEAPESERKSGHRPILLAGRSLATLFAVLALVLTGGAWQWSTSKNARLNTISALDPHSGDIRDPNGQYGDEDFLIVGVDSRAGDNANMGAG